MQFPIVSDPADDAPRLHRAHPEELHWRAEPPAWPGKTDSAHRRLYPHLTQQLCCMQCQAVPCPYDHERDQQLRLNDMSFVESLVTDKKLLQTQLTLKDQEIAKLKETQQLWRTDQRSFEKQLEDLDQANRVLEGSRNALQQETVRLRAFTGQQGRELTRMKREVERLEIIERAAAEFNADKSRLLEETTAMKQSMQEHTQQMYKLSQENSSVTSQYTESLKRVDSLQADVTCLKDQISDVTNSYEKQIANDARACEEELATLREKVIEKSTKLEKYKQFGADTASSRPSSVLDENGLSNTRRDGADEKRIEMEALLEAYRAEIESLKNQLAIDRRFRMYVEVLRERNVLRDFNESLTRKLNEVSPPAALPTLRSTPPAGSVRGGQKRSSAKIGTNDKHFVDTKQAAVALNPTPPPVRRPTANTHVDCRDGIQSEISSSKSSRLTRRPQEA